MVKLLEIEKKNFGFLYEKREIFKLLFLGMNVSLEWISGALAIHNSSTSIRFERTERQVNSSYNSNLPSFFPLQFSLIATLMPIIIDIQKSATNIEFLTRVILAMGTLLIGTNFINFTKIGIRKCDFNV